MMILDDEDLESAVGLLLSDDSTPAPESPFNLDEKYSYICPLSSAAEGLIDYVQNTDGRFMLGQPSIDAMTRGFGRGELTYITGRPGSGKTQLVLNAILNKPNCKALIFTPDEVDVLVLQKLIAMAEGVSGEEIERRIKQGDEQIIEVVRRSAREDFASILVIDRPLNFERMLAALREAETYWGGPADVVVIDYLELLPGGTTESEGESVAAKSAHLKMWTKEANVPVLCLHQSSRSSGPRGQSGGMDSMRYGGEAEATFVLEVFRKKDDKALDEWEREAHQTSVTVALVKCKRPPCKTGLVDLTIDAATGCITDNWRPLPEPGAAPPQRQSTSDRFLASRAEREERMRSNPIDFEKNHNSNF